MATAIELKESGNKYFRSGLFEKAADAYLKAEKLDPSSPIYASNLSATLYEQGKYLETLDAVSRSFGKLDDATKAGLLPKLSARLAKSLAYGTRNGSIKLENVTALGEMVDTLRAVSEQESVQPECKRAWNEWKRVEKDLEHIKDGIADARSRLVSLPVRKKSGLAWPEYYTVGQDNLMSILHDWGAAEKYDHNPVDLKKLSDQHLSRLGLFFAGAGNARHVFGSIIGANQLRRKLDKRRQKIMNVHITVNDLHASALARDLCVLSLLEQISSSRNDEKKSAELMMTILSMWMGIILPSYSYSRLKETFATLLNDLEAEPPRLPEWLYIPSSAIPPIAAALRYWDAEIGFKSTKKVLSQSSATPILDQDSLLSDPTVSSSFKGALAEKEREKQNEMKAFIENDLPEDQIIQNGERLMEKCPSLNKPQERKAWMAKARKQVLDVLSELDNDKMAFQGPSDLVYEKGFFKALPAFVPPAILRSQDELLDKIWTGLHDLSGKRFWNAALRKRLDSVVESTWKPIVTLFDRSQNRTGGAPDTGFNSLDFVLMIDTFNDRMELYKRRPLDKDCPSYSIVSTFFHSLNEALAEMKGHVQLEISLGDCHVEMENIRTDAIPTRPAEFPRKFIRMWLKTILEDRYRWQFLRCPVEASPDAAVAGNTMMNSGVWESGDHFTHNYMQLDCKDFSRFFGVRILSMDPAWGIFEYAQEPLPRPLPTLASREELATWLTRVLVNILAPSKTGKDALSFVRVRYPNNLTMFVRLLARLPEIGYPPHWISDYLHAVLSDTLVSDVVPYLSDAPIPLSHMGKRGPRRQLNLSPWRVELETILVLAYEAIPFPPPLPNDFAHSHDDIATFEAPAPRFSPSTTMGMNGFDPVFTLMFCKDGPLARALGTPVRDFVPGVLEGRLRIPKGDLVILDTVDVLGIEENVIRWRMPKERVRHMKEDAWVFVAHRFDTNESSSKVPAGSWREESH